MQLLQARGVCATLVAAVVAAIMLAGSTKALAVPSFARQTGMACEACHTVFPELTPFGRAFKMNGYLIDNLPQVKEVTADQKEALLLNWLPPLSVQFIASYTQLKTALPDTSGGTGTPTGNGTTQFPEAFSFFYAGRIAPKLGGFIQVTWANDSDSFSWDNTDIRFADQTTLGKDTLTWGVTFNNSPTVQDPWNSTPAWKYPFSQTSSLAPSSVASTQLDSLGNNTVAGLSAYGYWNNLVYVELGGYTAAPHLTTPSQGVENVHDGAPYGRIAVQPQWGRHSLEFGVLGFSDNATPAGSLNSTPTDQYRDIAFDAEYQFLGDDNIVSAELTYIHENQTLNATAPSAASNTLNTFRLGGSYFYQRQWGGSIGYFSTTGNTDPALYVPLGSANGSPDTSGWAFELDYLPWQNVKLALQYTLYTKFNGAGTNYDGTGRNASSNNTLYLFAWLAF